MNDYLVKNSRLELEVSDFGPIRKGKVDLRPLTVFIGPSNTGKSYLAILIYALHCYFSDGVRHRRHLSNSPGYYGLLQRKTITDLPKSTLESFWEWIEEQFSSKEIQESLFNTKELDEDGSSITLPSFITDLIQSVLDDQGNRINFELCRCFGSDAKEFKRKHSRINTQIVVSNRSSNSSTNSKHCLAFKSQQRTFNFKSDIPKEISVTPSTLKRFPDFYYLLDHLHSAKAGKNNSEASSLAWRVVEALSVLVQHQLLGLLHRPAFYFPADRTGIMHAHTVVVSALIGSASMTGLRPASRMPMLSGVLADFLEQLIELESRQFSSNKFGQKHAEHIENAILNGIVRVEKEKPSGYPRFIYQPAGWNSELPLMSASSMVSELAPIILYLRHWVRPGNVLIVEEPESHLHPAMQVEFTRQLAKLIQSGIRVIVTTHSEWVLEELANIVQRSTPIKKRQKISSKNSASLHPDEVGVWLFNPQSNPKGSVTKEISLDQSGLYPSGFDEVATALHNDWVSIANRKES